MGQVFVINGTTVVPPDVTRGLLVARDGFFQLKRLVLGNQVLIEAVTKMGTGWDDDSLAPWGGESVKLGFAEKIPQALLQTAVSFFVAVYDRFHTEAIVFLFYAPSAPAGGRWQIVAPEQNVEPARCKGFDPGSAPPGWYLAGDIHSHGDMGAFHSGVDDADEGNRDGIHITVGGVNSLVEFSVSVVVDGVRFKLNMSDVVAGIAPTAFPPEWLARVHKVEPPPPVFQMGGSFPHRSIGDGDGDGDGPLATYRAMQKVVHPTKKKGGKR